MLISRLGSVRRGHRLGLHRGLARLALRAWLVAAAGCERTHPAERSLDSNDSATPAEPKVSAERLGAPPAVTSSAPATGCDRGPIVFMPAPAADQQRLIDDFVAKNGSRPASTRVDSLGRHVTTSGVLSVGNTGAGAATDAELEASARAFVERNAALYGVTVAEVRGLERRELRRPGRLLMMQLGSSKPLPGYEGLGLTRDLRFTLMMNESGIVSVATNQSQLLPPFSLCTKPALAPGDPAIVRAVVGQSATFGDVAGRPQTVGPATAQDVGAPKLTIRVDRSHPPEITLTLAYAMPFYGEMFTAFVDANSGTFLGFQQNLRT